MNRQEDEPQRLSATQMKRDLNTESAHTTRIQDLPLIGSSYNFVGAEHGHVAISIYVVQAQPGRGAPLHLHEYDEIVLVQEGRSRFVIGDSIHEFSAGNMVVVKAGTPHGFLNIGDVALKQVDIHVSPRFKQQNLEPTEISRRANLPLPRTAPTR